MSTDHAVADLPLPPHEQARADFLALIGALLLQPEPALAAAVASAPPLPGGGQVPLARAWQHLVIAARRQGVAGVRDEHAALFVAPGTPSIDPYASRYLGGGFLMDEPLAHLRADLRALGIAWRPGAAHTEDHLGALCETMRLLITGAPGLSRQPLAVQRRFFEAHVAPWADACLHDIGRADGAVFYAAWAELALAFFDTERAAYDWDEAAPMETADDDIATWA